MIVNILCISGNMFCNVFARKMNLGAGNSEWKCLGRLLCRRAGPSKTDALKNMCCNASTLFGLVNFRTSFRSSTGVQGPKDLTHLPLPSQTTCRELDQN